MSLAQDEILGSEEMNAQAPEGRLITTAGGESAAPPGLSACLHISPRMASWAKISQSLRDREG